MFTLKYDALLNEKKTLFLGFEKENSLSTFHITTPKIFPRFDEY